MKFSVITATFNSAETLVDTLQSVEEQIGVDIEHIIKDGGSTDGTIALAKNHNGSIKILESSDSGIYDAMNQGFAVASGDVVLFLNSDDYLVDSRVFSDVSRIFESSGADIVYGDLEIIGQDGGVLRHWKSGKLTNGHLKGLQLPHPSFFVRRNLLVQIETPFDPSYSISADFKQQLLLINGLGAKAIYLPRTLVRMRTGGASSRSLVAIMKGWQECVRATKEVTGRNGWTFVLWKVLKKIRHINIFGK